MYILRKKNIIHLLCHGYKYHIFIFTNVIRHYIILQHIITKKAMVFKTIHQTHLWHKPPDDRGVCAAREMASICMLPAGTQITGHYKCSRIESKGPRLGRGEGHTSGKIGGRPVEDVQSWSWWTPRDVPGYSRNWWIAGTVRFSCFRVGCGLSSMFSGWVVCFVDVTDVCNGVGYYVFAGWGFVGLGLIRICLIDMKMIINDVNWAFIIFNLYN